jgi:hypothetical protein
MNLNLCDLEMDMKLKLIKELILLGLIHVGEVLKGEIRALARKDIGDVIPLSP